MEEIKMKQKTWQDNEDNLHMVLQQECFQQNQEQKMLYIIGVEIVFRAFAQEQYFAFVIKEKKQKLLEGK